MIKSFHIKYSASVVFFSITMIFFSCKKSGNSAGGGAVSGSATLDAEVKHHYWAIPQCTVYMKKNCSTFPGKSPSNYDSFQTADNSGLIHVEGLANGSYFFYAIGWDVNVADTVWGYNSVIINNKPGEVKNYELSIPVSE